jgi:ABC-2 type transport system permease protein
MPTGPFSEPAAPGFARATWMVAKRDMGETLRSKSFIISTAITLVALLAGFIIASIVSGGGIGRSVGLGGDREDGKEPDVVVAAGPELSEVAAAIPDTRFAEASDDEDAIAKVRAGDATVAVVAPSAPDGPVRLVADEKAPESVVESLTTYPEVTLLTPPRVSPMANYFLALAFGVIYIMMGAMFGQMIAQNTVIEKQTRIVEILLSAVPARAMIAGKILGGSILAVGETVLIVAICSMGLSMVGLSDLLALLTAPMWWYVVFFLVGFVMYAAMFCGAGALVSRLEDLGSASSPILMLVMAPYILVLALNQSPVAMTIMSYVPFTAPVAMPVELVTGGAGTLDALISLAILVGTTVVVTLAAVRIYVNSVLQTGSRIKVRQALRRRVEA